MILTKNLSFEIILFPKFLLNPSATDLKQTFSKSILNSSVLFYFVAFYHIFQVKLSSSSQIFQSKACFSNFEFLILGKILLRTFEKIFCFILLGL
jgi:hypothetical protein